MPTPKPRFTQSQLMMFMTYFTFPYATFEQEYLPHIDSIDHFELTLQIYRSNKPKYTWEQAAEIARM